MNQQYLIIDMNAWARLEPRADRMEILLERFMSTNEVRCLYNMYDNDKTHGWNDGPGSYSKLSKVITTWKDSPEDEILKP